MARETEIERLVVRIVGDDAGYRLMMQNAAIASDAFEQESHAIASAQEEVQEAVDMTTPALEDIHNETMRSSRSFRFLGNELQQAGMLVGSFNTQAGMTIVTLGSLTSGAGQAMHAYRALCVSISGVGALLMAHPVGLAVTGIITAAMGTLAILRSKNAREDEKLKERWEKIHQENLYQADRKENKRFELVKEDPNIERQVAGLRKLSAANKMLSKDAEDYAAAAKKAVDNLHWWEKAWTWASGKSSISQEDVNLSEAQALKYKRQAEKAQDEADRVERGSIAARSKGIIGDISSLQGEYAQLALSEKDAAKYAFMVKNEMLQYPNPELLAEWERTYDRLATIRITDELKSAVNLMEDMKDKNEEILDPLNSQLRITHELEKANRDYARSHNMAVENVPKEIQEKNKLIAAEREHQRLLQEGKTIYDQYKDPLDKMIDSQRRLKQLFEAGGFEKGEKGARAYQKALAEAYGQAHKDYTIQFQGQQFDALIGGTHAAERALYEYRLATTAIPLEMARASKSATAKSKSEGLSGAVAGLDDDDKQVNRQMANSMKSASGGIAELVKLTKEKTMSLSYATFT